MRAVVVLVITVVVRVVMFVVITVVMRLVVDQLFILYDHLQ